MKVIDEGNARRLSFGSVKSVFGSKMVGDRIMFPECAAYKCWAGFSNDCMAEFYCYWETCGTISCGSHSCVPIYN